MQWPLRGRDDELRSALRAVRGRPSRGVLIAGAAYVGRTRFLDELVERLAGRASVPRVAATRSAAGLPFAALGALAPRAVSDPSTWTAELAANCGGAGALLAVDDAQWLDDASAQLLLEAARSGAVVPLVTLRRGHHAPHAVTALWKDDVVARVELGPLPPEESDAAVEAALQAPVAAATLHELWDLCRGYPELLRRYVEGAVDAGVLVRRQGSWVSTAELTPSPGMIDAVRDQLGAFGPEMVEAVHLIALGEPLEAGLLDRLVPTSTLAAIERSGLVVTDPDTDRYRIAAPGARAAILAALQPSVMRAVSRRLASAAADREPREDDLVRFAVWRLDGGQPSPDDTLFVRAAERAASTLDHDLVERLARAALPGGGVEARLLLANALIHQHRHGEAEQHLAAASRVATTDEHHARAAGARARLLFFRLGRVDEAIAVLERACGRVTDPDVLDHLRGTLALLVSMGGRLGDALEWTRPVLARPDAPVAARAIACTSAAFVRVMRGELAAGARLCEDGLALPAEEVSRAYPLARPMLDMVAMVADVHAGRLDAGELRARAGYRQGLEAGADELVGIWAVQLAALLLYRGDVRDSLRYSAEARQLLSQADTLGVHNLAYALGAMGLAEAGRVPEAQQLLDELVDVRALHDVRSMLSEQRARAAVAAAAGELRTAAELVRASVETALAVDHRSWGLMNAHLATRLGYPELVLDLVEELGAGVEGPLVAALVGHTRALAAGDVDGVEAAARELATIGVLLWASEAYAQASRLADDAGARQRGARLRATAGSLLRRCPEAVTPATRGLQLPPLTRREREVAMLATAGLRSREIASRLVVSPRTVENHLASVYRKLDISGRDELADALAVRPDGA